MADLERSSISHLLRMRCPPYVVRSVVAICVDPINRVLWRWTMSNISEKVFERSAHLRVPPSTDRDASPAIIPESDVLLVVATLQHRMVRVELWAIGLPMRSVAAIADPVTVADGSSRQVLPLPASTRTRIAVDQVPLRANNRVPAVTLAYPQRCVTGCTSVMNANRNESSESSARDVRARLHAGHYTSPQKKLLTWLVSNGYEPNLTIT